MVNGRVVDDYIISLDILHPYLICHGDIDDSNRLQTGCDVVCSAPRVLGVNVDTCIVGIFYEIDKNFCYILDIRNRF